MPRLDKGVVGKKKHFGSWGNASRWEGQVAPKSETLHENQKNAAKGS